jgi:hypothetical protein
MALLPQRKLIIELEKEIRLVCQAILSDIFYEIEKVYAMKGIRPVLAHNAPGLYEVGGLALNFYAIKQVDVKFPTNFGKPLLGAAKLWIYVYLSWIKL